MFEIHYTLTDNDYLNFNKHHALMSPSGKKQLLLYRWIAPIFLVVISSLITVVTKDVSSILPLILFTIVFSTFWIIFSKRSFLKSVEKNIRNIQKEGNLPYSPQGTLIFDDNFINDVNSITESKTPYTSIKKIYTTDNAIYVYFNSVQAYIIPTTCFATQAEIQTFVSFITSKAPVT